jgi:FMN phosphatase YigB (HAD superfamily)
MQRGKRIKVVIKTIFFDLGNVIIPFDFKRAYAKLQLDARDRSGVAI